jgi:hypothetical protein
MNTSSKVCSRLKRILLCVTLGVFVLNIALTSRAQPANGVFTSAFDQYGNLCWEDEQARLDNFAIHIQKVPGVGDIVVYAGRLSCPDEAKYRLERARKHMVKRGMKPNRLQIRDGGYREQVETILWVVPPGIKPPALEPTLTKEQVSIRRRCVDKLFEKVLCLNP